MLFALASSYFYRIVSAVEHMAIEAWEVRNLPEQLSCAAAGCLRHFAHPQSIGGGNDCSI